LQQTICQKLNRMCYHLSRNASSFTCPGHVEKEHSQWEGRKAVYHILASTDKNQNLQNSKFVLVGMPSNTFCLLIPLQSSFDTFSSEMFYTDMEQNNLFSASYFQAPRCVSCRMARGLEEQATFPH
jgi:hypothetical protein